MTRATDRLRIAYLPSSLRPGGAERQMLSLAERLPKDRFAVDFLALSGAGVYDERALAAGARIRSVGETPDPSSSAVSRMIRRGSKIFRYAALGRSGHYDVIDAWLYPADVLAALARPLTGTPVIISGRRNVDPQDAFGPAERLVGGVVRHLTDMVVANSAAAAANAIERDRVDPAKVRVIRNGVLIPAPATAAERAERRAAIEMPADALVVACVANFLPVKRHDLLIEAFATVAAGHPELRLVLVGDGPLRPAIEAQVRELGLGGVVRLHGHELRPEPLYAAFDIVIQASAREGLPNALLEAGAAGRALVATDAGGSREIVIDGQTGLLVPTDSAPALGQALGRLVADEALRRRLAGAVHEHVETAFGMDRFVAEFGDLYQELVAAKRKRMHRWAIPSRS
ncbi:MAG TPA: glycosyltransferase [Candidatus Limnocylindrales bacterium]|nr:glycosyltransferase [Candidatus Limnocylindrales bacterium]